MPSHLHPRPGTASAVGRLSIGCLVGSQCNFDQPSIVARMSSRDAKWPILGEKTQSWAKKRNPGPKNRVFGTFSERFYREGGRNSEKFSRAGKQFFCAIQVIFRKPVCEASGPGNARPAHWRLAGRFRRGEVALSVLRGDAAGTSWLLQEAQQGACNLKTLFG